MPTLDQVLQTQLLDTNESSLSTAEKTGTPQREEEQYNEKTVNVQR